MRLLIVILMKINVEKNGREKKNHVDLDIFNDMAMIYMSQFDGDEKPRRINKSPAEIMAIEKLTVRKFNNTYTIYINFKWWRYARLPQIPIHRWTVIAEQLD